MHTYNHWITDIEQPTTAKAFTYTIWFPLLGKRYIGYKTISTRSKWLEYKSSSRLVTKLLSEGHTAVYRIIKWFDNATDARAEEIAAMTAYDVTNRPDYLNRSIGGVKFSGSGNTHTAETRAKLSAANKGKTLSAETRAKISAARKGRKLPPRSDETRAKISAALKGRKQPPVSAATREKMSAAHKSRPAHNKGKTHTDESRAKMSAVLKGKTKAPRTTEHRAKLSASRKGKTSPNKGKTHTDETLAKMSRASQIGLYVTPCGAFHTANDAAIANNCHTHTISNRCNSTSAKFNDWAFFRNP
ncbi:NUMOD3 domain-containing DNA-binding protein [Shewanella xiamenensis]|uniref:NUMOD3 domain-containing DNA-binding protein n=1 Tax=Shewanella xiamenensis TaxID=332186 RepID=UPI0021C234F5|nr:NUMOD3 domain-containing DNA-binding protein [Shewanella xiamenensis]MCT8876639.1 hypothetical protein [Shewanella xiamenensis]